MRQSKTTSSERIVKDIKRQTRKRYSAEEKIRIALDGPRSEESIAELRRLPVVILYFYGRKVAFRTQRLLSLETYAYAKLHADKI